MINLTGNTTDINYFKVALFRVSFQLSNLTIDVATTILVFFLLYRWRHHKMNFKDSCKFRMSRRKFKMGILKYLLIFYSITNLEQTKIDFVHSSTIIIRFYVCIRHLSSLNITFNIPK